MKDKSVDKDTITRIAAQYKRGEWPSFEEFNALLSLSASSFPEIREAALTLLLHPPVDDELVYLKEHLFPHILASPGRGGTLPAEVVELICDVVGFLGEIPQDIDMRKLIGQVLSTLTAQSLKTIFGKPLTPKPFLPYLRVRTLAHLSSDMGFRRKWRLFRKRVSFGTPSCSWSEITLRDINSAWRNGRSKHFVSFRKGRWLSALRPLMLHPRSLSASPPALSSTYWAGFGNLAKDRMELLVELQAEELASVRSLARAVSEQTGRVVLSWHNATLAAAGGWAFPALTEGFPSEKVRQRFLESIERRKKEYEQRLGPEETQRLFSLWEERLIRPRLLHALWESRVRARLDSSLQERWEANLDSAKNCLWEGDVSAALEGGKLSWHEVLSPHQRWSVKDILVWRVERRRLWQEGFLRLAAIIEEGQRLVREGNLPFLVLPWIDKFFISSRREEDLSYLPAVIQWIESLGLEPLVIFWEDTSHAASPSFQLALKRLSQAGKPYRGIGIFDWNGSSREDALEIIRREHNRCRLFAVRPHSDTHNHHSFHRLIERVDHGFVKAYDSSWKDNLSFLYAGTQVYPFLSPPSEAEDVPAWVGFRGFKHPFGTYLRKRLRKRLSCRDDHTMDRLSRQYAFWANLC